MGTPREIYAAPATTFVARFVGTPQMNLVLPAVLGVGAEDELLGIRPEDLEISLEARPGSLAVRVWLVEPVGPETWVTVERDGARLVARSGATFDAPAGAPAHLSFDPARLHRFDAASGRRRAPA